MSDLATPNLPSRDFDVTEEFYARLGFATGFRDDGWMILTRGALTLEFFAFPDLDPATSSFGSCLRLDDVDELYDVCVGAGVPVADRGFPRLHPVELQSFGLRIGALLDPDGSLLRLIGNAD